MAHSKNKNTLIIIFSVILAIGLVVAILSKPSGDRAQLYQPSANNSNNQQPADIVPYRTTLVGTYVCLPHKDTTGPQTMECAFGLKTDDGKYYSLDFRLMSQIQPANLATGNRIKGKGLLTPVEMLSSIQKYNIKGVFSVTDSFEILN